MKNESRSLWEWSPNLMFAKLRTAMKLISTFCSRNDRVSSEEMRHMWLEWPNIAFEDFNGASPTNQKGA